MQRLTSFVLGLFLLIGGLRTALAQEKADGLHQPPKVLVIAREFLKPGKAGMTHQKSEAAFVQAFATAKWPTYYLAINSMSGKPRSLFLTGYDSFEAVEKDNKAVEKNGTLTTALDRASLNDGELLSDFDQGVFVYREDLSLHAATDIPHMRYFEIMNFRAKPGHEKEFEALAKIYINAYDKVPDTHWAAYEVAYGSLGNTILLFSLLKPPKSSQQSSCAARTPSSRFFLCGFCSVWRGRPRPRTFWTPGNAATDLTDQIRAYPRKSVALFLQINNHPMNGRDGRRDQI